MAQYGKGPALSRQTLALIDKGGAGNRKLIIRLHATFAVRKLDSSKPLALPSEATRASHSPDNIDEYALVVVLQVGQLVGEVGEVVADAGLQVLANMTIDRGQRAASPLTYIR